LLQWKEGLHGIAQFHPSNFHLGAPVKVNTAFTKSAKQASVAAGRLADG
jgi:hypothetical protein